ncbi:MAG: tetratricopeptide repeat protein [Bacteroidia bacterium]
MQNNTIKFAIFLSLSLFSVSLFFVACSTTTGQSQNSSFAIGLEPRKNIKGIEQEWENIQKMYNELIANLNQNPNDSKSKMKLVALYMNEARVTGASSYYPAALNLIQSVLSQPNVTQEDAFLGKSYQASILLSLHQFAQAKKVAEEAVKLNTYDAGIYGALVDANIELGNYEEAVKMCDKMLSVRPDLRSYSRASYMRQIFGDNAGAIAAMKMAIQANPSGLEATEWARVNLGDLYLNQGKLDTAKWIYEAALHYRPGYAYAEMGLAKVAKAEKNYGEAINHTQKAIKSLGESSFVSFLAEMYELKGEKEKAQEIKAEVLTLLEDAEEENEKETLAKHNGFRELAMAKLDAAKMQDALEDAKKDLALRPNNIDANELVAWIYYKMGDKQNAKLHADNMLKTNTQNAITLHKAALIYAAAGEMVKANELKNKAENTNKKAADWVKL